MKQLFASFILIFALTTLNAQSPRDEVTQGMDKE